MSSLHRGGTAHGNRLPGNQSSEGDHEADEGCDQGKVSSPDELRVDLGVIWGHLHGLLSPEIRGSLGARTAKPEKLYRNEVNALICSFGLTPALTCVYVFPHMRALCATLVRVLYG
ncbi:hypothetical protein ACFYTS_34035 [Nocardia sp. NPDC004151]|uniref:hypothetical protein n=1 Tax=Nocardia sp. NPDC004151 TaxID=3364304 RepID=UPI0036747BF5